MNNASKTKVLVMPVLSWQNSGGLEAVSMDVALSFASLGWRVNVFPAFDPAPSENVQGVKVVGLCPGNRLLRASWYRYLWKPVMAWQVRKALAGGGMLLFGHTQLLPLLDCLGRLSGVRCLIWTHGLEVWGDESRRWAPYLNRLNQVVSVSAFTKDQIACAGVQTPIVVIPNSVDVYLFTPTTTPERIRRNEILICGRMASKERYKGHEVLFQSLPLAEQLLGRELSIRVIGEGDDLPRLQDVARRLNIFNRVFFVGRVSTPDLIESYRHCSVFCMPSRVDRLDRGYWTGEGFGVVYIEAAACGRPVIASTEGGAPETITPGKTGLLVDPRSPGSVARVIAKVLADPVRADEMGRQGRLLAKRRFSREQYVHNINNLILSGAHKSQA